MNQLISYSSIKESQSHFTGEKKISPDSFIQIFKQSAEYEEMNQEIKNILATDSKKSHHEVSSIQVNKLEEKEGGEGEGEGEKGEGEGYPTTSWEQFLILTKRTWISTIRDPAVIYVRTATALAIGLLVGIIFFNIEDVESSASDRINAMLFVVCVFSLFCLPAISKMIDERLLFTREHAGGYYRTSVYLLSNFIVELPILFLLVFAYSTVSYWMVRFQPDASHFFFFFGVVFFTILTMFSFTQFIASISSSVTMALAIYLIVLVYSLLLGGFIVSVNSLPAAVKWASRTSYFYYSYEALCVNEFEDKTYGRDVLESTGMYGANKYLDLGVLIAIAFGLRLLNYVVIRLLYGAKRVLK